MAFYTGNEHDIAMIENRLFGRTGSSTRCSGPATSSSAAPLAQAGPKECRRAVVISIIVNVGMWLERFVIIVTSLHRDFLPSSWGMYHGTFWGRVDLPRHARPVLLAHVPLHPLLAVDLDLRDADDPPRSQMDDKP